MRPYPSPAPPPPPPPPPAQATRPQFDYPSILKINTLRTIWDLRTLIVYSEAFSRMLAVLRINDTCTLK